MSPTKYVQPVAHHQDVPERLLLRDEGGQWFLWMGDGRDLEAIPTGLAIWMLDRPEMRLLGRPHMWFEVSCLPLDPATILADQ